MSREYDVSYSASYRPNLAFPETPYLFRPCLEGRRIKLKGFGPCSSSLPVIHCYGQIASQPCGSSRLYIIFVHHTVTSSSKKVLFRYELSTFQEVYLGE